MLFDSNLGFIDLGMFQDDSNDDLYSTREGFLKGNMFVNEYRPYKNYKPGEITFKNEKDKCLVEIMELCFAIGDLNLYLDLHSDDKEMLDKFKSLVEKSVKKEMEYVEKYGPLELIDSDNANKFIWIDSPWPWEKMDGDKYV